MSRSVQGTQETSPGNSSSQTSRGPSQKQACQAHEPGRHGKFCPPDGHSFLGPSSRLWAGENPREGLGSPHLRLLQGRGWLGEMETVPTPANWGVREGCRDLGVQPRAMPHSTTRPVHTTHMPHMHDTLIHIPHTCYKHIYRTPHTETHANLTHHTHTYTHPTHITYLLHTPVHTLA